MSADNPTPSHLLHVVRDEHGELENPTVICAGVTSACETWWECRTCMDVTEEQREAWQDELDEDMQAHGVEHRYIGFGWAVRGDTPRCIGEAMDDGGNYSDAAEGLPAGKYPVELDGSEDYVSCTVTGPAIAEAVSS